MISTKELNTIVTDPKKWGNKVSLKKLVKSLEYFSDAYYNTEIPIISDIVFDTLYDILMERDPNNAFITNVGAPISKDKIKLPYPMGSLTKIKKDMKNNLDMWIKTYDGPYMLSDKLDGVSALIIKDLDGLTKMYTRGDGLYGQDITHLIKYVLPENVMNNIPNNVAIRGELIIPKDDFNKISKDYKNARNATAGLVNAKHYSAQVANITNFVGYSVIHPQMKISDGMKHLLKWKIPTVNHKLIKSINFDILEEILIERRRDSEYEIDGIVVIDNSKKYKTLPGNPQWGFAYKQVLEDQVVIATVLNVSWTVSMYGYLKPRIEIDPVDINGVTIKYATAFNAKYIFDNKIGKGSTIKLVRSGDVIPYILEVLTPSISGDPDMPNIDYKWNDTGVDILVEDIHGSAYNNIKIKQIVHFFNKIDVKHMGEGIVTILVKNGYDTIMKILQADETEIAKLDRLGKTVVTKIYKNIHLSFKNITLSQLMGSSPQFGRGFGERKIKLVTNNCYIYDYLANILMNGQKMTTSQKDELREKILEVDGYDEISADGFLDGFSNFIDFWREINTFTNLEHLLTINGLNNNDGNTRGNTFANTKIVFTGFRNKNLQKYIEENGGVVSTGVSNKTSLVIYNDESGAKYKKAIDLGIDVISLADFLDEYNIVV